MHFNIKGSSVRSPIVSHIMPYSRPRLEGRALEHGFAGDRHRHIRMKDKSGVFVPVTDANAKEIRRAMDARSAQVREELASKGVSILSADCPVVIDGKEKSVDLRSHHKKRRERTLRAQMDPWEFAQRLVEREAVAAMVERCGARRPVVALGP